jgi:hypothetical protein
MGRSHFRLTFTRAVALEERFAVSVTVTVTA